MSWFREYLNEKAMKESGIATNAQTKAAVTARNITPAPAPVSAPAPAPVASPPSGGIANVGNSVPANTAPAPAGSVSMFGGSNNSGSRESRTKASSNPLNDYAKTEGFTGYGEGQGNAAFQMAAAKSLYDTYSKEYQNNPESARLNSISDAASNDIKNYLGSNYYNYTKGGQTNTLQDWVNKGGPIAPKQEVPGQIPGQLTPDNLTALVAALQKMLPQQQQVTPYVSPYADTMKQLTDAMLNYYKTPYQYDINADPGLKQAQNQAMNITKQEMAKMGRLYSRRGDTAMQQAAQSLIPQYQQLNYQQYQDRGNAFGKQLGELGQLENMGYGRYRDTVADARSQYTNDYNRAMDAYNMATGLYDRNQTQIDRAAKAEADKASGYEKSLERFGYGTNPITGEIEQTLEGQKTMTDIEAKKSDTRTKFQEAFFGRAVSPKAQALYDTYETYNQDPEFSKSVADNYSNLAAMVNSARDAGNEELAQAYEGARLMKILMSDDLIEKYGAEYGISGKDVAKKASELRKSKLEEIKTEAQAYTEQIKAKYAGYQAEIDLAKAQQDLEKGAYDNYIKKVQATYIEAQEKQQLINLGLQAQNIQSSISTREAASERAANAEKRAAKKDYDYKRDPEFADDIRAISESPAESSKNLEENSAQIIRDYGYDGYLALVKELDRVQGKLKAESEE